MKTLITLVAVLFEIFIDSVSNFLYGNETCVPSETNCQF